MNIFILLLIVLINSINLKFIKEQDFKETLIKLIKEKDGLCSLIDGDYVNNYNLLCLLRNSSEIKEIKSQVESLDYIESTLKRVVLKTQTLVDGVDKSPLVYALNITDKNFTNSTQEPKIESEAKAIETTIASYLILVCNNFVYRVYLTNIDYLIKRVLTKLCPEGLDCKVKDQDAASKINTCFNLFSRLLSEDDKKNINLIYKNIDSLDENEVKLLSQTLKQLRDWVELDSVKPSTENETYCIANAKDSYDTNKNVISYDIWKKDFVKYVAKASAINPIQPDTPVNVVEAKKLIR